MTREQLNHYLAGGKFSAIYNPKILNLRFDNQERIGERCIIHQNCVVTPIISPDIYEGQHRFDSNIIKGWSPTEDFDDIQIINEYIDFPEKLPQHFYKLTYTNVEKIIKSFGKSIWKVPLIIDRSYISKSDEYVVYRLSEEDADKVQYTLWNGELYNEINWLQIFPELLKEVEL